MNKNATDKRKSKRYSAIIIADVYSTPERKFICKCCITDFSLTGILIETNEAIEEDDIIIIKFLLPDGQFFEGLRGRIVRAFKETFTYAYGIRFLEVGFKDRLKLWSYALRTKLASAKE